MLDLNLWAFYAIQYIWFVKSSNIMIYFAYHYKSKLDCLHLGLKKYRRSVLRMYFSLPSNIALIALSFIVNIGSL